MSNTSIADNHRVARHCTAKDFADPETKVELKTTAFAPTEGDPNVSVNWLEYHDGDDAARIAKVCKDISSERAVRHNHKLAILGCGRIRDIGSERGHILDVLHDRRDKNESHAEIVGVPLSDRILHQELADAASENLVSVIVPQ